MGALPLSATKATRRETIACVFFGSSCPDSHCCAAGECQLVICACFPREFPRFPRPTAAAAFPLTLRCPFVDSFLVLARASSSSHGSSGVGPLLRRGAAALAFGPSAAAAAPPQLPAWALPCAGLRQEATVRSRSAGHLSIQQTPRQNKRAYWFTEVENRSQTMEYFYS